MRGVFVQMLVLKYEEMEMPPYLASYVSAYVSYVCPMKSPMVGGKTCFQMMPAPPVDIQQGVVEIVESAPRPLRGLLMDSIVTDRLNDARYIVEHAEEYVEFLRIASVSQQTSEIDYPQYDETEL